jgi:hypothetical protein
MPYKSEQLRVGRYDRRYKLSDEDKNSIRSLYKQGLPIRAIARLYEGLCCRRNIQFVLFPDRSKSVNNNSNANRVVTKAKHVQYTRDHRRYKYRLYREGKI